MCVCRYVCTYICRCEHTYIHMCTHVYIRMCTYTCVYIDAYACVCIHMYGKYGRTKVRPTASFAQIELPLPRKAPSRQKVRACLPEQESCMVFQTEWTNLLWPGKVIWRFEYSAFPPDGVVARMVDITVLLLYARVCTFGCIYVYVYTYIHLRVGMFISGICIHM